MLMDDASSYGISWKALPRGAWNVLEYLVARTGPFAGNVFESTAFLRIGPGLDRPDVQFVFQPARRNQSTFPLPIGHGFAMSTVLLYPKSRGRLSLASPDPAAAPIIDPNLFAEPEDFEPLLRALRVSRRIFASPAFARYRAKEFQPGAETTSDEELIAYVRRSAATVHHPCGTCRMGADADSVVDPQLRVRGVEGLRVADASIFPRLMGGNTNAPVIMVAEKAADMILGRPALAPAEGAA
jgi:choline dehydrogenase-like flavoprotein